MKVFANAEKTVKSDEQGRKTQKGGEHSNDV